MLSGIAEPEEGPGFLSNDKRAGTYSYNDGQNLCDMQSND